tara:strand:+ start:1508 stop:2701 length:1194 start_codon:yes stop_codon:yes gene_type:complete
MSGLQKLKVAFDNFDDKGPLPNLNDSIYFNNWYKISSFNERVHGFFTIPAVLVKMWKEDRVEFVKKENLGLCDRAIYPIKFYTNEAVDYFCYFADTGLGPRKPFFHYEDSEKISHVLICLDGEPITEGSFYNIKNILISNGVPKEKLVFIVNNPFWEDKEVKIVVGTNEVNLIAYLSMFSDYKINNLPKEKKFCILNHSANSNYDFRQATLNALEKRNLLRYADYSHQPVEKIRYVTDKPIPSMFRKLLDNSDTRIKETKLLNESIENNSYFSLVLEAYYKSFFAGKLYITEKSLRPMRWKKPFIVVGQLNTLKALQKIGYKTFHPFIDESYDTEDDLDKRFIKIMIEVEKLCNKSLDDLQEFNTKIKHILEHNHKHFETRIKSVENYLLGLTNENI